MKLKAKEKVEESADDASVWQRLKCKEGQNEGWMEVEVDATAKEATKDTTETDGKKD